MFNYFYQILNGQTGNWFNGLKKIGLFAIYKSRTVNY